MNPDVSKVGKFWSKEEPIENAGNFYASPLTRPYIIEMAYGKRYVKDYADRSDFAQALFVSKYLAGKRIRTILSLCCGFGYVERQFLALIPGVEKCLGLDVAEGAIQVARKRALEARLGNLHYECADLNNCSWQSEQYDLVIANGALHHINNLEGVLGGIRRTLRPDGLLYACEYVGASHADHSLRQIQLVNAAAFLLPPQLRSRRGLPFSRPQRVFNLVSKACSVAERKERPEWSPWKKNAARLLKKIVKKRDGKLDFGVVFISLKNELLRTDPSEGVRSSEIIPLIKKTFPIVEVRPFGGGILQNALDENFYDNFDRDNPLHVKTLELLCHIEQHFMATGEVNSDNAFIIAQKK
jgi:SAM-dependent methyltransferase